VITLNKRRGLLLAILAAGLSACSDQDPTSKGSLSDAGSPHKSPDFPKWSPGPASTASGASGSDDAGGTLDSEIPPPPPEPYDPAHHNEISQLKSRLYDQRSLISQTGPNLFSAKRVQQSLLFHLSHIPVVEDRPKPRRLELKALSAATSKALQPLDIAQELENLLSKVDVRRFRGAADITIVSVFNAMYGTSIFRTNEALLTDISQALSISAWRRAALAWLTTATRSEAVERHIATECLPYVISHLGLDSRKFLPVKDELIKRADALAFARVHIATAEMSDLQVYGVVRNFQITRLAELYETLFLAYRNRSNSYLTEFHNEMVQLLAAQRARPR